MRVDRVNIGAESEEKPRRLTTAERRIVDALHRGGYLSGWYDSTQMLAVRVPGRVSRYVRAGTVRRMVADGILTPWLTLDGAR